MFGLKLSNKVFQVLKYHPLITVLYYLRKALKYFNWANHKRNNSIITNMKYHLTEKITSSIQNICYNCLSDALYV